ncbi:proline-rich protein 4-like [Phragmites australis]|uniref:proline-rich protein 4-like n=1 Tax=Phragmites australis TaxID=29695 RepID=UPI002D7698A6|nr:proline-rich protein 4-like [Phragmites australis]
MGAAPRRLLLGVCAVLMAIAVTGEAASVVVGLAKCADCTRKNMKAQAAFRGLQVAIKCKNANGEYESKAVGKLENSGEFTIPLAADLHGADCLAQLHSLAGAPCPGQEPSRIVAQSEGTFVAVPGKTHSSSAECASATICGPIKKHFFDHFHKKPVPPKPKPQPEPQPEYHPPTPTYGSPTPIYHPPATHLFDKKHVFDHFHKDHDYHHFFDHFHKKPVPPKPKPEPKPQPEYHPPTPTYGSPTPIYHPPAKN